MTRREFVQGFPQPPMPAVGIRAGPCPNGAPASISGCWKPPFVTGDETEDREGMTQPRIVDLSPPIAPGLAGPHTVGQKVEVVVNSKPIPPGTHWQGTSMSIYTHTGSHIDALIHCRADGWTTDAITLEQVIGTGLVIDLSSKGPSEPIDIADFEPHAQRIRPGDMVLLRTDWSDKFLGTPTFFKDSPYVTERAVSWLADREPKLVGFDFTEDYCIRDVAYDPRELYCHQIFMGRGIPILEQLTNLGDLPGDQYFDLFAPFVKLVGSDGSLARVFAIVK
jgi:arylformamidase